MRPALLLSLVCIVLASHHLNAAERSASEGTIEIPPTGMLSGSIARSAIKASEREPFKLPIRIYTSPSSPGRPAMQQRLVVDADLHQIPFPARVRYNSVFGQRTDRVRLARAKLNVGGVEFTRTVWSKEPSCGSICGSADVAMGPAAFPQTVVRYMLASPIPTERRSVLDLTIDARDNASARIPFRSATVDVLFAPDRDRTLANAAFARLMGGVRSDGGQAEAYLLQHAADERVVVSDLAWTVPFRVGEIDILGAAVIGWRAEAASDGAGDIVVTGRRGDERQPILVVGRDVLSRCSSIEFDKKNRQISLSCR